MDHDKTWHGMQVAGLHDPFIHAALHLERHVGREQALIACCLALADERRRLQDRIHHILEEDLTGRVKDILLAGV